MNPVQWLKSIRKRPSKATPSAFASHANKLGVEALEDRIVPSSGQLLAYGADSGAPHVKVYSTATSKLVGSFFAFETSFGGGVRTALGDVDNDGFDDVIVASGPGRATEIKVYKSIVSGGAIVGINLTPINDFFPFGANFTLGAYIASANMGGGPQSDIIVGAGGGAPRVIIFDGSNLNILSSFFAYDPSLKIGVTVAVGQVGGTTTPDIVTGTGAGGAPHVKVIDGAKIAADSRGVIADSSLLFSFFAYATNVTTGVNVACGNVVNGGVADIITAPMKGGGPNVKVFDGANGSLAASFFEYDPAYTGGVHVGATDRFGAVLSGPGAGFASLVDFNQSPFSSVGEDGAGFNQYGDIIFPGFFGGGNVAG